MASQVNVNRRLQNRFHRALTPSRRMDILVTMNPPIVGPKGITRRIPITGNMAAMLVLDVLHLQAFEGLLKQTRR